MKVNTVLCLLCNRSYNNHDGWKCVQTEIKSFYTFFWESTNWIQRMTERFVGYHNENVFVIISFAVTLKGIPIVVMTAVYYPSYFSTETAATVNLNNNLRLHSRDTEVHILQSYRLILSCQLILYPTTYYECVFLNSKFFSCPSLVFTGLCCRLVCPVPLAFLCLWYFILFHLFSFIQSTYQCFEFMFEYLYV